MSQKEKRVLSKTGDLLRKWQYTIALVGTVIIIALLSVIIVSNFFQPSLSNLLTFWVSFLIGMVGASVYLMVLLMTDTKLRSLENDIIDSLSIMTILYIMSGGFVAAVTQTTTGILSPAGLQAVFMIGFGWQGALSGVGASGNIRKAIQDFPQRIEDIIKFKDDQVSSAKKELEDLKKRYMELTPKEEGGKE